MSYFLWEPYAVLSFFSIKFAVLYKKVGWPSGLGTGLQNQVQRFESATDL